MADQKRQKPTVYNTPAGTAAYPRVNGEPDTKFKPEGVWSVKLKFKSVKEPGVQAMLDRFEAVIAKAKQEAQDDKEYLAGLKKRGKKLSPADRSFFVDEETGEVSVNFKMTATGKSKKTGKEWSRRPAVFDASGKPLAADAKVGSGSTMKVAYTCEPFYTALGYGCSIRLEAVQVLNLVEWGQGQASDYGFANEAEEDEDGAATDAAEGGDDAGDGDDF